MVERGIGSGSCDVVPLPWLGSTCSTSLPTWNMGWNPATCTYRTETNSSILGSISALVLPRHLYQSRCLIGHTIMQAWIPSCLIGTEESASGYDGCEIDPEGRRSRSIPMRRERRVTHQTELFEGRHGAYQCHLNVREGRSISPCVGRRTRGLVVAVEKWNCHDAVRFK